MANEEKACPCSRLIEDVADAVETLGDMHQALIEYYERRTDALAEMEDHRIRMGVSPSDTAHPLIETMMQIQSDIHLLNILVRASGVMAGIPDQIDLTWMGAEEAFHSDDAQQAFAPVPPNTTKH